MVYPAIAVMYTRKRLYVYFQFRFEDFSPTQDISVTWSINELETYTPPPPFFQMEHNIKLNMLSHKPYIKKWIKKSKSNIIIHVYFFSIFEASTNKRLHERAPMIALH